MVWPKSHSWLPSTQYACGIANATGVQGHINDLLLDLRRLTGVGILQEKRPPTPQETLSAPVALFAFRRRAVAYNIRPVAETMGGTYVIIVARYHTGGSVPLRQFLKKIAHQQI